MRVRIQVIKVPDDCDDPIAYAYGLQTTKTEDEVEANRRMLES